MGNQSRSMHIATYSSTYSLGENLYCVGVTKPLPLSDKELACLDCLPTWLPFHWVHSICSLHSKHNPSRALDKSFCFLSSRHITAGNCFPLNKLYEKWTSSPLSLTSLASHKLGRRNASQALRTRCVVGGGELVVGYGPSAVGRMVVIVIVVVSTKIWTFSL